MKCLLIILLFYEQFTCDCCTILLNDNNEIKEGNYFGSVFMHHVFVKIKKDTAIVDWVHVNKGPISFFTDTIKINKKENKWQGRISSIIKKNELYIECIYPYSAHSDTSLIRVKIQINEIKYKNCEVYKNQAFMHKENSDFNISNQNKSNVKERWAVKNKLENEYTIVDKIKTLSHKDFLKEYEKFKQKLLKELLLVNE